MCDVCTQHVCFVCFVYVVCGFVCFVCFVSSSSSPLCSHSHGPWRVCGLLTREAPRGPVTAARLPIAQLVLLGAGEGVAVRASRGGKVVCVHMSMCVCVCVCVRVWVWVRVCMVWIVRLLACLLPTVLPHGAVARGARAHSGNGGGGWDGAA